MLSHTTASSAGWVIPEAPAAALGARLVAAGILGAAAVIGLALGFAAALVPTYLDVVPASQVADARAFASLAAPLVILGAVLAAAAFGVLSSRRIGILAAALVASAAALASGQAPRWPWPAAIRSAHSGSPSTPRRPPSASPRSGWSRSGSPR